MRLRLAIRGMASTARAGGARERMSTDPALLVRLVRTPFEAKTLLDCASLGSRIDACFALIDGVAVHRRAVAAARATILDDGDVFSFAALPLLHDLGQRQDARMCAIEDELRACAKEARTLVANLAITHGQNSMTAQELAMSGCEELAQQKVMLAKHERVLIRELREFLGDAQEDGEDTADATADLNVRASSGREAEVSKTEKTKKPLEMPVAPPPSVSSEQQPLPSKTPVQSPVSSAAVGVVPETPCINASAAPIAGRDGPWDMDYDDADGGRRSNASSLLSCLSYHSPEMSSSGKDDLDSSQPLGDASNSQGSGNGPAGPERAKKRHKAAPNEDAMPSS